MEPDAPDVADPLFRVRDPPCAPFPAVTATEPPSRKLDKPAKTETAPDLPSFESPVETLISPLATVPGFDPVWITTFPELTLPEDFNATFPLDPWAEFPDSICTAPPDCSAIAFPPSRCNAPGITETPGLRAMLPLWKSLTPLFMWISPLFA